MGVEIAITVAREETRVAVLDNGVVTDLFGDRAKHKDFVGNIYKGKVAKVLPGMQAAFVDIGLEKAAFMHVSDLSLDAEPNDTLSDSDDDDKDADEMRPKRESSKPIEQLLTEGQELMVQISKGPIGTKGPRVTTYVSLPGRYLVFMPNVEHIGVSRRIARDEERARLKDIMKRVRHPGCGYIVRTVSEGVKEDELRSDVDFLHVLWQDIKTKRDQQPAPALLHTDLSLSFRVVRDLFGKKVERLWIDSREEYDAVRDFVQRFSPEQTSRIHFYDKDEGLFDYLGVEQEMARALSRKVWLKSGGLSGDRSYGSDDRDRCQHRPLRGKTGSGGNDSAEQSGSGQGSGLPGETARDRRHHHRRFHRYGAGEKSGQGLPCLDGCHGVRQGSDQGLPHLRPGVD